MITVNYGFYRDTFHGQMDEADFYRLSIPAAAYVEGLIGGAHPTGDAESIRLAVCACADVCLTNERGGAIASESNDGISVSYSTDGRSGNRRLYDAAALYLNSTGLLFAGV